VKLLVTAQAASDLDEIENYIGADNPRAAVNFISQITENFGLLADNPGIGRRRDDIIPGLRSISEGNHLIFYRTRQDVVEILRILHGARDVDELLSSDDT